MRNVKFSRTPNGELSVLIKISGEMVQSATGKSMVLATTGGNVDVTDQSGHAVTIDGKQLKLGLTAYVKA